MLRDSVNFTTLKSLDYNVVMTFRFNNNNNMWHLGDFSGENVRGMYRGRGSLGHCSRKIFLGGVIFFTGKFPKSIESANEMVRIDRYRRLDRFRGLGCLKA